MHTIHHIKIRGYHIDAFAHVNHARYLQFMEEARWDYFDKHRDVAEEFTLQGIAHATVHISINYHHPAVLGDMLRIETGVFRRSRRSITFGQEIFLNDSDRRAADAQVVNVYFNRKSGEILETQAEIFSIWEDLRESPFEENKNGS